MPIQNGPLIEGSAVVSNRQRTPRSTLGIRPLCITHGLGQVGAGWVGILFEKHILLPLLLVTVYSP